MAGCMIDAVDGGWWMVDLEDGKEPGVHLSSLFCFFAGAVCMSVSRDEAFCGVRIRIEYLLALLCFQGLHQGWGRRRTGCNVGL